MSTFHKNSSPKVIYFWDNSDAKELKQVSFLLGKKIRCLSADNVKDSLFALTHEGVYDLFKQEIVSHLELKSLLSGSGFNLALSTNGDLYSWGEGQYGELGLGPSKVLIQKPSLLALQEKIAFVSVGLSHSMAIDTKGNAYGWGQNFDRQLGLYDKKLEQMTKSNCFIVEMQYSPRILPLSLKYPINKVSCGPTFTAVVLKNGQVYTWGSGECGQLGIGRCTRVEIPALVAMDTDVKTIDVACGFAHVLALNDDGSVSSWGLNKRGQLGVGDTNTRFSPTVLSFPPSGEASNSSKIGAYKIFAEGHSSACIDTAKRLLTWGSTSHGRLIHSEELIKKQIALVNNVEDEDSQSRKKIIKSSEHLCAPLVVRELDGNVVCDFAFSKTSSAVMVLSQLYKASPVSGPQKAYSNLSISGCGFWDSDTVIVKFTSKVSPFIAPRSCVGKVIGQDLITCKPPRFTEIGEYEISVSLNGVDFMPDTLSIHVYKDFSISSITPNLIDTREMIDAKTDVILRVKDLDLELGAKVVVKFVCMLYEHGHSSPVLKEFEVDATVFEPDALHAFSSLHAHAAGHHIKFEDDLSEHLDRDAEVEADEGSERRASVSEVESLQSDGTSTDGLPPPAPLLCVKCAFNLKAFSIAPGTLVTSRVCVSINGGLDYCPLSPDTLLLHAFQALACLPDPRPVRDPDLQTPVSLRVQGDSFLPGAVLPGNMRIEALVGVGVHCDAAAALHVPVHCTAAHELFVELPTLARLQALVPAHAPTHTDANPKSKKKGLAHLNPLTPAPAYTGSVMVHLNFVLKTPDSVSAPLCREDVVCRVFSPGALRVRASLAYCRLAGGVAVELTGDIDFKCTAAKLSFMCMSSEGKGLLHLCDVQEVEFRRLQHAALTSMEFHVPYKLSFVCPDLKACMKEAHATIDSSCVYVNFFIDGITGLEEHQMAKIALYDTLAISGPVPGPKGGTPPGTAVTLAVTGLIHVPATPGVCCVRIRGSNNEGVKVNAEMSAELDSVTFTVPDAAAFAGVTPEMKGKDKLFYIDISIDNGETFDNSAQAVIQLKI